MSEPAGPDVVSVQPLVLLVEDEPQMRRFLRTTLGTHGYRLLEATTAREGLAMATEHQPDLVLLDLGLPDEDGLVVTGRMREWTSTPIIVLSARGQESDKVEALDAGADDYLTKPFGVSELLARMRVALRHQTEAGQGEAPTFDVGDIHVDLAAREVRKGGGPIHLTPLEYRLLTTLIKHAGKLVTHSQLLREVWGPGYATETHYLRIYMAQLRHKLEDDPARPKVFITEPGVGYRLRAE